jgi:hypothetical protein
MGSHVTRALAGTIEHTSSQPPSAGGGATGRRGPTFRDARALITGSFRVRGWVWLLSMLWVGAGAVVTSYIFYATTNQSATADIPGSMLIGINAGPAAVQIGAVLAMVAWLTLPLPVGIAGLIRLRGWRPANRLRAAAWAGAWIAGAALLLLAHTWGDPPGVSWRELPICATWLVVGTLMTWILAVTPARRSDVPSNINQASSRHVRRTKLATISEVPTDGR